MAAPKLGSAPNWMKLDKIFNMLCRTLMLINPCPREQRSHISTHTLEFVHRGLCFPSMRAFTYCCLLSAFYFIANYTLKTSKLLLYYYWLLVKSVNQYLQLLLGSINLFLLKNTTINLLHLGGIIRQPKIIGHTSQRHHIHEYHYKTGTKC
jgi:hypothetical protein